MSLFSPVPQVNFDGVFNKLDSVATRFEIAIQRMIDARDKPFVFLRSNRNNLSSNSANDVLIFSGPAVPTGYKGLLKDLNITFSTVAGTIKIVVVDQENSPLYDISTGMSSSSSGSGDTVLEEGQRVAILGQTAGAGIFGVNMSGILQKINP